ncbi:hypothetical protein ACNOYE_37360 [Nannocystaceae bacterium ST9]
MSRTSLAPLVILLAFGCTEPEKKDAAKKVEPASTANAEADAGEAKAETSTTTTTTSTTSAPASETETEESDDEETGEPAPIPDHFDEIGVAVCDQYVTDFQRCIDEKVPEPERAAQRRTLADNHASWTQTKKGGDSAAKGLQIGCRAAREQAKAATTAFGCEW